jgi:hypothetical protein
MRQLLVKATENLGRSMPPRLSIDSNRFTLIDSTGNEKPIQMLYLDVVIIDLNDHVSKMYWGKEYNPTATGDIPLCWSDNGSAPSNQADKPQSPTCLACPHNVIGSAISKFTGSKIKACTDMKKMAFVLPPGSVDGVPTETVFLFTMKPGSFNNWKSYINFLKQQRLNNQTPELYQIVTRLSFESQGVLKFEPVADATPFMAEIEAAFNKGTTPEIVGQNDVPWTGQLAAPVAQQTLPPPAQTQGFMQAPIQPAAQAAVPATAATTVSAATASPSEPPKRTRRTKAQIEADNAAAGQPAPAAPMFTTAQTPAPQAPMFTNSQPAPAPMSPQAQTPPVAGQAAGPDDGLTIPAFLQRNPPAAAPAAPAAQSFGLQQPAAADPAMQAAIAAAFNLPTN